MTDVVEQPDESQVQTTEVVAPPAPAAANDAPWSSDLNLIFQDEATRAQVDQYMREKVQPYQTKLEQDIAATKDAQRLFNDLTNDPATTYAQITQELYGEDAAQAVFDALNAAVNQQQEAEAVQQQQYAQLDPQTLALLQQVQQQQEAAVTEQEYAAEMAKTIEANPDINPDNLHIWVSQAEGDFDAAVGLYRQYISQFQPQVDNIVPAPNVTGSDTGGAQAGSTPTVPGKQTLDQALDSFFDQQRELRQAPPIG